MSKDKQVRSLSKLTVLAALDAVGERLDELNDLVDGLCIGTTEVGRLNARLTQMEKETRQNAASILLLATRLGEVVNPSAPTDADSSGTDGLPGASADEPIARAASAPPIAGSVSPATIFALLQAAPQIAALLQQGLSILGPIFRR